LNRSNINKEIGSVIINFTKNRSPAWHWLKNRQMVIGTEQRAQKQNHAHAVNQSSTRTPTIHHGTKIVSSINGAWKMRYSHKKNKMGALSYTAHKNQLKMD
jgi:hypothetical protein